MPEQLVQQLEGLGISKEGNDNNESLELEEPRLFSANSQMTVLPPIRQLEPILLDSAESFLHILPLINDQIEKYLTFYPDQLKFTVQCLKPLLKDMRRRFQLHLGTDQPQIEAPICKKIPYEWTNVHQETIHDDYAWLTDKDDPEVAKYLEAENQYADACLAHTKTLQRVLNKEFISRLDQNAESAKVMLSDGWLYFTRKVPAEEYRLHCRLDRNGFEEVYLDENHLADTLPEAANSSFFHLGFCRHSSDCRIIAYGVDTTGSERYTTFFKDVEQQKVLEDVVPDCYEDFEFGSENSDCFYVRIDEYERAYQLRLHKLGTPVGEDRLFYEESDEMFCLTMTKSSSRKYLFLNTAAQVTSETRYIDLTDPAYPIRVVFPKREKIQYQVEHHHFLDAEPGSQDARGYFYVMSNEKSKNMQIYRVPILPTAELDAQFGPDGMSLDWVSKHRESVIDNRDFVLIEAFQVFCRHLVVFERSNCMQNIRVVNLEHNSSTFDTFHYVSFPDGLVYSIFPTFIDEEVANLSKNIPFDTNTLRFIYTSFVQPRQVVDYNMDTRAKIVVHEERVLGPAYDREFYVQKRVWATSYDGTAIPMSIVYRKDLIKLNSNGFPSVGGYSSPSTPIVGQSSLDSAGDSHRGSYNNNQSGFNIAPSLANPLLLHGYGAYGYCVQPIFSNTRLSLLDRGFIYAVAHVRGGSDQGNGWYQEGKLAKKTNTFDDFIACAEYLIKEGYTSKERLAIYGRSAGGLLIGAVVNKRPDLFKAVLTEVPFVDVINTMFDTSIPWTAFEFEEWGNPEDPRIYNIMKSYCPYSNVIPGQIYPHMLIIAGMNDPRVAYFEPAKWTAKLRALGNWSHDTRRLTKEKMSKSASEDTSDQKEESQSSSVEVEGGAEEQKEQEVSDRVLLFKIQDAGHSGPSGQYQFLEDLAFEYAYIISSLNARFRPENCGFISEGDQDGSAVDYSKYWDEVGSGDDLNENNSQELAQIQEDDEEEEDDSYGEEFIAQEEEEEGDDHE
ncbi:hypothetical protein MP228_004589 [Amoeboaphelidium protococcarum]|nr:hypothetical protein MP228_004589 [Amoeboaphelidium protococcarum]